MLGVSLLGTTDIALLSHWANRLHILQTGLECRDTALNMQVKYTHNQNLNKLELSGGSTRLRQLALS